MKINFSNKQINFTRAFSTEEKAEYKKLEAQARKELNLQETGAVVFDFNMPDKKGYNYGLGTLNSDEATNFIDFLQGISSINKVQMGPQSELAYFSDGKKLKPITSPYSGSTFSLGIHTISLLELTKEDYGEILDEDFIKNADENYQDSKVTREYKTDYSYALGDEKNGVIFEGLKLAYDNFKKYESENPEKVSKLSEEFKTFKDNLSEDQEKEIVYNVLSNIYHKMNIPSGSSNWSYVDKNLYTDLISKNQREERLKTLQDDKEFLTFCQFIAHKQHMETKDELNKKGINLYGDCLVCFSDKEVWGNKECFLESWYTGGKDPFCPETNGIQPWGSPALNYELLGEFDKDGEIVKLGKTGELLYKKFKNFMDLYDGIRMDAFWQYVSPFIYNDSLEGKDIDSIGDKIIKIMEKAAKESKNGFDPNRFVLELIGFNTEKGKELTKNIFPHVYSTAYAEYNENPKDLEEKQGYKNGFYIIGATSHDNDSLVNMSRDKEKVKLHTPILERNLKSGFSHLEYENENYQNLSKKEKTEQDFRTAKFAEAFTSSKQYFTLPDLFGMSERINISGKTDENNWSVRVPSDYEKFYYTQLSKGYGLNFPKSYSIALHAKGSKNEQLLKKLDEAAEILASNGPMTTKEADIQDKKGTLKNKLNLNG